MIIGIMILVRVCLSVSQEANIGLTESKIHLSKKRHQGLIGSITFNWLGRVE